MAQAREATHRILQQVEDGVIDTHELISILLMWLTDDEVEEMAQANDLFMDCDDVDEDEDEGFDSERDAEALASAGFGTDEDY